MIAHVRFKMHCHLGHARRVSHRLVDALPAQVGPPMQFQTSGQLAQDAPLQVLVRHQPRQSFLTQSDLFEEQQRRLSEQAYPMHEAFAIFV